MHGDIGVSSNGDVYVSVEGSVKQRFAILGPNAGLQVYAPSGRFLRNVPNAPLDLHGFVIRKEADREFLYGVRLARGPAHGDAKQVLGAEEQTLAGLDRQVVVKMTLDGRIVMAIPPSAIPDRFKNKADDGTPFLRLTAIAVAPSGDIYVADGNASDYIHRFDRRGRYLASFGGQRAPYGFNRLHQLEIDTRFSPPRIVVCDRENNRVVHLSLAGDFLGVVTASVGLPTDVAVIGEHLAVAQMGTFAEVTLFDRAGQVVGRIGTNETADEIASYTLEPVRWRQGVVVAPHGLAFTARGDLLVAETNTSFGRVHRFNLQTVP